MIRYILEENDKLNFKTPLDVENPFSFEIQTILPSSKIFLIDYTISGDKYIIKSQLEKSAISVVKSICNLYPNMMFKLNIGFLRDEYCRSILYKTCIRTLQKRDELKSDKEMKINNVDQFKNEYLKVLKDLETGDENENKLVQQT